MEVEPALPAAGPAAGPEMRWGAAGRASCCPHTWERGVGGGGSSGHRSWKRGRAGPGEGSAGSRGGRRQSGGGSMERCSPPAPEQEAVEAWLDDHGDFTRSYFVRKATR